MFIYQIEGNLVKNLITKTVLQYPYCKKRYATNTKIYLRIAFF